MFGDKGEAVQLVGGIKKVTTILDEDCEFEGKLTFQGSVVINGVFTGEVFSQGELIIGEQGRLKGNIDIRSVRVHGEVHGDIKASEKIEIDAPAKVYGNIQAPSLVIKEGAIFEGNCTMGKVSLRAQVLNLSSAQELPGAKDELFL